MKLKYWNLKACYITGACIMSAILADILFYGQPVGWNVSIYLFFLTMSLTVKRPWLLRDRKTLSLVIALVGLNYALIADLSSISILLYCIGISTLALSKRKISFKTAFAWYRAMLAFLILGWTRFFLDNRIINKWRRHRNIRFSPAIMLRWVLPICFSMIFVVLFSMANPVISEWIKLIGTIFDDLPPLSRFLFWAIFALLSWSILRARRRIRRPLFIRASPEPGRLEMIFCPIRDKTRLNELKNRCDTVFSDMVLRSLILFNILFAIQNVLDCLYLWGGTALPSGMTYAQYAHRGAYPLVATAILAALFMLLMFRPQGVCSRIKTARVLVYMWIAQNVFLLLSSGWRLKLYVDVYTLSRLRIAAAIWMLLIAGGLVSIGVRIIAGKTNNWLVTVNLLKLTAVLYICCFINFDGFIAMHNVRNCREITGTGAELDLRYLKYLGPEALPALSWLANQPEAGPKQKTADEIAQQLKDQLVRKTSNWRSWTIEADTLLNSE